MTTQEQLISKYYSLGLQHRNQYHTVREAVNFEGELVWAEPEALIAYEAGLTGCEMPRKVSGWRYGNIPANGHSYNYRDDHAEGGVSLMATDDGLTTADQLSGLFISDNRPVIRVEGWLNTVKRGADGEPLVFWARKIS